MGNDLLDAGAGGAPAPKTPTANPLQVEPKPRPPSGPMTQLGGEVGQTRARFEKMKEAEAQITATVAEMGKLAAMADTVTSKDVVKACAGIVASGVPAVTIATILADMPEQPGQLQGWVKQKADEATAGEAKVSKLLGQARHQMLVAGLHHVVGHSAEAHASNQHKQLLMAAKAAGSA